MTSTSESERAFHEAVRAQNVPRMRTLIDAGAVSLDDLEHYKKCGEGVLADFEFRMTRCDPHDFMIYMDHLVPKQKEVNALLESARARLLKTIEAEKEM